MPKPIFIMYCEENPDFTNNLFDAISNDYYMFVVANVKETRFEMFSDKNIDTISLENLVEKINSKRSIEDQIRVENIQLK